jgi:hypothetical protein
MIKLSRAQISQRFKTNQIHCIDTSIKSAKTTLGKLLAPTWDMVMGSKRGTLSNSDYTKQYLDLLQKRYLQIQPLVLQLVNFCWAQDKTTVIFQCYCNNGDFCHTYIIIDWLMDHFPEFFNK